MAIYKIVPRQMWNEAEAKGVFDGAPVDHADGFIHFSTAAHFALSLWLGSASRNWPPLKRRRV